MLRPDAAARLACGVAALVVLLALSPASAAPAGRDERKVKRLEQIERDLATDRNRAAALHREAASLNTEIAGLQTQMVAAAAAAQDHEAALSDLEDRLARIEQARADKAAALAGRRRQLIDTLAALQRLSLQPPVALMLGPGSPLDTVRSAMLLRIAVPALKTQAATLRQDIQALDQLDDEAARRRGEIAAAAEALAAERTRIAALIDRKRELRRTTVEEQASAAERVAALAAEAKDLRDLLARLETPPPQTALLTPPVPPPGATGQAAILRLPPPAPIRAFPTALASLTPPARGDVVTRFGEPSHRGLASTGITIETRPHAQVVAPFDGQVVFRGPFRGYGEILIIEHRGGYHSVLVGLGRTDAAVGQWLLAGEPVGMMGPATDGNPQLYLELRHGGSPIDPLPWLKTRDSEAIVRE